jgi:hypothetical protein
MTHLDSCSKLCEWNFAERPLQQAAPRNTREQTDPVFATLLGLAIIGTFIVA